MSNEIRSGTLPHDLGDIERLPIGTDLDFRKVMERLSGGITVEEAFYLRELAASIHHGAIVEVGSFRGKSSVALSVGARRSVAQPQVYCVEPHQPFTGIYGGEFGPTDRCEFFRAMLATNSYQNTSLINLGSEYIGVNWPHPVGLCFIDGDHSYAGVKKDFEFWEKRVIDGGVIVFDDAANPEIGPFQLIAEIVARRPEWVKADSIGKFVVLQKRTTQVGLPTATIPRTDKKRLLVVIEAPGVNGGLIRFHRLASVLEQWGHEVCFLPLIGFHVTSSVADDPFTSRAVTLQEARNTRWDAVMVPGQGFLDETIQKFPEFQSSNYGVRVQHILNDIQRIDGFRKVNQYVNPDVVIFNNNSWPEGSYTDFRGKQFHVLEGAVDSRFFTPAEQDQPFTRSSRASVDDIIIGGLAIKNPYPLLEALRRLPDNIGIALFGPTPGELYRDFADLIEANRLSFVGELNEDQLRYFYTQMDMVISTEEMAGWSNLSAEAMASGVPVICTEHGTRCFAVDGKTAWLLSEPTRENIAATVMEVLNNREEALLRAENARELIRNYDWESYSGKLLEIISGPLESHYYRSDSLQLYGKWGLADRFKGLGAVFEQCRDLRIIDLGAAEGLVSLQCMTHGAASTIGFEIDADRVNAANRLLKQRGFGEKSRLYTGNLSDWQGFLDTHQAVLETYYDMVLYLGIHHHLGEQSSRIRALSGALSLAGQWFVIRTPTKLWSEDNIDEVIRSAGWQPFTGSGADSDHTGDYLGDIRIYSRTGE